MDMIRFSKEGFEKEVLPKYFTGNEQADYYYYFENGKQYMLKKYRKTKEGLDNKIVEKIKLGAYLPNDFQMLIPKKLVMIDDVIVGFTSKLKRQYLNIDKLDLTLVEKINLLFRIKELFIKLLNNGVCFYDINSGNIIFNGRNILFCNVPDAYLFFEIGKKIKDEDIISLAYKKFNLFTVAYLNDIRLNNLEDRIEKILYNWSNLKEYEELIGIVDNQDYLRFWYDLMYDNECKNEFLVDYIKPKIKQKKI